MPEVDPAGAVKAAYQYLMSVSQDSVKYSNAKVEEVKLDEKNNYLITISYDYTGEFPFDRKREYKDFVVEKATGNVISMSIRKL